MQLAADLQVHIDRIEQHNRDLHDRKSAIQAGWRGTLSVDQFCGLEEQDDIAGRIQNAERDLAAARHADAIRLQGYFEPIVLPELDTDSIAGILGKELPDLELEAVERVQQHLATLGDGGEAWVGDGMTRD